VWANYDEKWAENKNSRMLNGLKSVGQVADFFW
jgi:hypothetical protein